MRYNRRAFTIYSKFAHWLDLILGKLLFFFILTSQTIIFHNEWW